MNYQKILQQLDYESAACTYVLEKFGTPVAQTFPILASTVLSGLFAGKPESIVMGEILARYSLKPL